MLTYCTSRCHVNFPNALWSSHWTVFPVNYRQIGFLFRDYFSWQYTLYHYLSNLVSMNFYCTIHKILLVPIAINTTWTAWGIFVSRVYRKAHFLMDALNILSFNIPLESSFIVSKISDYWVSKYHNQSSQDKSVLELLMINHPFRIGS